jgi:hypothetical protein
MTIKAFCPHCDRSYTLVDTLGGKKIRCKSCAEVFRVPPPHEDKARPAAVTTSPAKRGVAPPPEDDEVEDVLAADDEADAYEEDRPSRRRRPLVKARSGVPLWVWLAAGGGGALLLLIVVVLVLVFAPGVNKATPENYRKLKQGMSENEVTAILGAPHHTDERNTPGAGKATAKVMVWMNGPSSISVTFTDGKVTGLVGNFVNLTPK